MQTLCRLDDCLVQFVTAILYSTTPYIIRARYPLPQYSTVYAQTKALQCREMQYILAQRLSKTLQGLYKDLQIFHSKSLQDVCRCVGLQELNRLNLASGLLSSETPGSSPDHLALTHQEHPKTKKDFPLSTVLL